jgi:hypothetical protein
MLTRSQWNRASGGAALVVVCGATLLLLQEPHGSAVGTTSSLSDHDVATVRSYGQMLSTDHGASVSVVRAPGAAVWNALFPRDWVGPDTDTIKTHDLLVVVSHGDVPQGLRRVRPGDKPVAIDAVRLVIDTTDGRLLVTSTSAVGQASSYDTTAAQLGTVNHVTVN